MPAVKTATARSGRLTARRLVSQLHGGNPLRLIVLAAVALTIVASAASIWWLYTLSRANTERELTNMSLVVTEHVNRAMQTIDLTLQQSLERLQTHNLDDPADRLRLHHVFEDVVRNVAHIYSLAVYDQNGDLRVISRQYPAPDDNVADREYFKAVKEAGDRLYISRPGKSSLTGEWGIVIVRPIRNMDGSFAGIVRVGLSAAYFQEFFSLIDIGSDTVVTLIRSDGILLLRSPVREDAFGRDVSTTPVFTKVLVGRDFGLSWHKGSIDHLWRYAAARRLPNYPLVLVLSVSSSAAMANWRQQSIMVGLGAVATILFLMWISHIAGRQLMQRERRTRQALDAANEASRAKSSFLAVMSHELRTPLNAIIGFSDVISRETFGPVGNTRYRDYVRDINQSGRNLLVLINQILDLSRIEAGKHEMAVEALTLQTVWQPIANEMAVTASTKNIRLTLQPAGTELVFAGEGRALMQVISNLVSNAVKFTPEGGHITVSAEDSAETREIAIAVADTGRGIPADKLVDVLKPFVQLSDSYTRETGGVGLGLSICQSLTHAMGGRLTIESTVGQGTIVRIHLRRWIDRR